MAPSRAFNVLGPLQVVTDGRAVRLPPAHRRLLSILCLEPFMEAERDVIVARLWGDAQPSTARTALQVHVSTLRRAVPWLVASVPTGYRLALDGVAHDRADFEVAARRVAEESAAGEWGVALAHARRALALWRGTPYIDLPDDEVARAEADRLMEVRASIVEHEGRALVALGRLDEAVGALRSYVRQDPLREPAWGQLMLSLYRSGRTAEALRTYEDLRRILGEELGVEPGPDLRLLGEQIRFHDPVLGDPPGRGGHEGLPSAATSFVGRERDLGSLEGLISADALVTITGGPGVGKTRLAVEVGRMVAERRSCPVWFASLADARSPQDVTSAIATATRRGSTRRASRSWGVGWRAGRVSSSSTTASTRSPPAVDS